MALVLKSALLIIDKNEPQLRYALSSLAMLTNSLLPLVTFSIIYRAELAFSSVNTNVLTLTKLIQELNQTETFFTYQELVGVFSSMLPYIAIFWLATVTLLAGKLLLEIYNVNRLPQQGCIEPSAQLSLRFTELAKQVNLTIAPKLLISLKVDVPMAIGWLKPVVLIPASMISGLNNAQLEMLILHELAHIRRYDYLVNFLQTFVEILLFFHPAVLWISKQMRNEREYCSDDIAVQHCGDAVAYAHTLADTATLCTKSHHQHTIPSMAMAASGGDLKQRVVRLVDHHCAPQNNISKWFASATIIFSILLLSSKQLLTMPLLDIWHKKSPWQANTDAIINGNSLPDKTVTTWVNNTLSNQLPNTSIANQLLTAEQKSEAENTTRQQKLKTTNKISLTASSNDSTPTLKGNNKKQTSTRFSHLTKAKFTPATPLNKTKQSQSVSMVEKAFERTDSHHQNSSIINPYAEELAQLAADTVNLPPRDLLTTTNQQISHDIIEQRQSNNAVTPKQITLRKNLFSDNESLQDNRLPNSDISSLPSSSSLDDMTKSSEPLWHEAQQIKSVDPVYPSVAKRKGIEIEVKVNFTIDVNGNIKDINFARQNKVNYFKGAIRNAVRKWRFQPAKLDGLPVESQMSKVFAFSLKS
ncbi:MAG: M56 family metallopeptidase [Litorilituus sp.]|nr:M56 family metallopeptidase [Litorilituus sp.]